MPYLRHHREGWAHMCMLYSHIETLCFNVWISLLRKETHIKNTCILWSHRSKLAYLWTTKNLNLILILINFRLLINTHPLTHTPSVTMSLVFYLWIMNTLRIIQRDCSPMSNGSFSFLYLSETKQCDYHHGRSLTSCCTCNNSISPLKSH